jgi:hypothetical protein
VWELGVRWVRWAWEKWGTVEARFGGEVGDHSCRRARLQLGERRRKWGA